MKAPLFLSIAIIPSSGILNSFQCDPCIRLDSKAVCSMQLRLGPADTIHAGLAADETDGWDIQFDRFLIIVGDVEVREFGADVAIDNDSRDRIVDLTVVTEAPNVSVFYSEASTTTDLGPHHAYVDIMASTDIFTGNASQEDVDFMIANGFAIYLEVTATKDNATKTLAIGFNEGTQLVQCLISSSLDGNGRLTEALEIHGEELFVMGLGESSSVQFDWIADADANDDGIITREELAASMLESGDETALERLQSRLPALGGVGCGRA